MKAPFLFGIVTALILIISGCGNGEDSLKHNNTAESPSETLYSNEMDGYKDTGDSSNGRMGYVRYKKDQLDLDQEKLNSVKVNREQIADMITRMILRYDGFEDVGTLVTDSEILVAYTKPEEKDRIVAADMVRKTAYSMVPSFYNVYISDQSHAFADIQSLSNSTVYDAQYKNSVDSIIKKFQEAPQGKEKPKNEATQMDRD
ncbi:YhcN/YlaJ family sporulation lipoprotein [Thalassobacillus sp. CUG 92003]|uniref:YhcN/YlaJ family sporulation lipoprotein n=1 Tax=Thalassobacillus sp. CUG 92003 TaxID=2736641 RepID=UPI0015E64BA9|nr:YhcN/YlaJ family sporulation lipoprotein [Thalassobacillus sp. CUG 92003]